MAFVDLFPLANSYSYMGASTHAFNVILADCTVKYCEVSLYHITFASNRVHM